MQKLCFILHYTLQLTSSHYCDVMMIGGGNGTCLSIIKYFVVTGPDIDWLKDRGQFYNLS